MDANESKIAEFVRLGIFFTNFSIRPSKMIKRHNFCKGIAWFSLTNDKGLGKSFSGWREEFQKFGEIFSLEKSYSSDYIQLESNQTGQKRFYEAKC